MTFDKNMEEVLTAFEQHRVQYMLVGGYAVNFYGYERNTSDLDIWVQSTTDNIKSICSALTDLGFEQDSIAHILSFDLTTPFLFHIGTKPNEVEIFNSVTGLKYEEAAPHKVAFLYAPNLSVWFISIQDLIVNKMITGRLQDQADVEMLQRIQQNKI